MERVDLSRVYAQALDFLKLSQEEMPLADLNLTLQDAVDQLLTDWPDLETTGEDAAQSYLSLTNAREIRSFDRAAGAFAAWRYLSSPATASRYLHIVQRKMGDNEKRFAGPAPMSPAELAEAAKCAGNDALGRIPVVKAAASNVVLAMLSGPYQGDPSEPRTIFEQAFGPRDSDDDYDRF